MGYRRGILALGCPSCPPFAWIYQYAFIGALIFMVVFAFYLWFDDRRKRNKKVA